MSRIQSIGFLSGKLLKEASSDSRLVRNVGIGTTTPTHKLNIAGQIKIDAASSAANTDYLVVGNTWPIQLNFGLGAGYGGDVNNPNTDLNFGASSIKEVASWGLVLQSGGSATRSGSDFIPITDNTKNLGTTANRWTSLNIGSGASTFAGNVGIGTTSPSSLLHVSGGIIIQSGGSSYNSFAKELRIDVGGGSNNGLYLNGDMCYFTI